MGGAAVRLRSAVGDRRRGRGRVPAVTQEAAGGARRSRGVSGRGGVGKGGGAGARRGAEARGGGADLEAENRDLRQHVSCARERVQGLLSRMTFLEDQAREAEGNGARRSAR